MTSHPALADIFLLDVEATGPSPFSSVMTEFGVVRACDDSSFHGHLWDFHPHPDIPALPIAERENPGYTIGGGTIGNSSGSGSRVDVDEPREVYEALTAWLREGLPRGARAVAVSDNPGFDAAWMAYGFDAAGLPNPFGHSARRIGDLAAGLGVARGHTWRRTSAWKRLRRTRHDHNPVNDARGNAEALRRLLREHDQL